MELLEQHRIFAGWQRRYQHRSGTCECDMRFSVFLPPQAEISKVPVLYWLSGLTCTDENFSTKAGAQRHAARLGLALVMPDTSPRGDEVPDDPQGDWNFGHGAGFYVNATRPPWQSHYQMFDYISSELPALVESELPLDGKRRSISGHSMGGHGALVAGLRLPDHYRSISTFAPIASPSTVPWGRKAFSRYLGEDESSWEEYDACKLLAGAEHPPPILVDQGGEDPFLKDQLQPHLLLSAAEASDAELQIRMQSGYDHSYYFIASFIDEHLDYHWQHLKVEEAQS